MARNFYRSLLLSLSCAFLAVFSSHVAAQSALGVTSTNQLIRFDVNSPGNIITSVPISGIQLGENILSIDFRPATGELLALGSTSRLYVINTSTGAATQVGTSGLFSLNGTSFGFDVNPTVDRVRVVSDADQNIRLNPATGALAATDTQLAFAAGDTNQGVNPNIVGSAYTNNVAGALVTTLYGIDTNLDVLVMQTPPNNGTLTTVGGLNVDASGSVGFDIVTAGGVDVAYATLQVGGVSGLYRINLATGASTLVGNFLGGVVVTGLAIDPNPPRLLNISTRAYTGTGGDVLIGGFVIGGSTPKTVAVIARGPSLAAYGITGTVSDPQLQLFSGSSQIAYNNNWQDTNASAIQATGLAPSDARESVILTTLAPGAYTAIVTGVGNTTGVAIVEVYEIDAPTMPLMNISARGLVTTGQNVMIGGFVITGSAPRTVVVRALGPSLANYGVTGVLANPQLQLFSGSSQIAYNDNWQDTNAAAILASGFAPTNPQESAIRITLPPGAYTAVVTGVNGGTGVGIVEVYVSP
jgi:hypothetical protein